MALALADGDGGVTSAEAEKEDGRAGYDSCIIRPVGAIVSCMCHVGERKGTEQTVAFVCVGVEVPCLDGAPCALVGRKEVLVGLCCMYVYTYAVSAVNVMDIYDDDDDRTGLW